MIANVEAEAALLGAMLIQNDLIQRIADHVDVADFYEPGHARIFEAVVRQSSVGKSATAISVRPLLESDPSIIALGGMAYVARLSGDGQGLLAPFDLAEQVSDLAHRRRMQAGLTVAADACADQESSLQEIMAHAEAALSAKCGDGVEMITIGDCINSLVNNFGQTESGVQCHHIPELDELLGPMKPKQLVIGAGRPGMGKTALALSYALGAAEAGHGVLYVSLEMSAAELAVRAASALSFNGQSGVPYSFIRDNTLERGQQKRIAEIGSQVRAMPFEIADAGSLTLARLNMLIRRYARRLEARGEKLELVIVDYLQLLHPDSKGRSQYEAVSEISRGLKAMAKDNGIAIFALAQLSRSVESRADKRPQLSDLRDSGQIEQDADAVLFLLRPEYYINQEKPAGQMGLDYGVWQQKMDAARGIIEFILAKRRNGETGAAIGSFHGAYQAVRGAA